MKTTEERCPQEECQCEDWPPDECPQCGATCIGFTPEDWWYHFDRECYAVATLYCFAREPEEIRE